MIVKKLIYIRDNRQKQQTISMVREFTKVPFAVIHFRFRGINKLLLEICFTIIITTSQLGNSILLSTSCNRLLMKNNLSAATLVAEFAPRSQYSRSSFSWGTCINCLIFKFNKQRYRRSVDSSTINR